jgi:hypothetical protein
MFLVFTALTSEGASCHYRSKVSQAVKLVGNSRQMKESGLNRLTVVEFL